MTCTDGTPFLLQGGNYTITVAGDFVPESGSVELKDRAGNTYACFFENGSVTIELRFAPTYQFALTDVTDLIATVQTAAY